MRTGAEDPRRDLSDPNDPFYDEPWELDDGIAASGEQSIDRAVMGVLEGSGRPDFLGVAWGAREGFSAAEARSIAENPQLLEHLRRLWRLQPPTDAIIAASSSPGEAGHWHRELLRLTEYGSPPGRGRPVVDALKGRAADPAAGERELRPRWVMSVLAGAVAAALLAAAVLGVYLADRAGDAIRPAVPPTLASSAELPKSAPLAADEFVIPRGPNDRLQLYAATTTQRYAPRRLAGPESHRLHGPSLSADRRSLVYIDSTDGTFRAMASDGTGDRLLFAVPETCDRVEHFSLSPTDQNTLVTECLSAAAPARLLVLTADGRLVRTLTPGPLQIGDPTISPDGLSVAYWASDTAAGTSGGSLYVMPLDGSSVPRRLTLQAAGTDADPAWSPDGGSIAFRRQSANQDFDLYRIEADGTGERALLTGPAHDEKPTWSPRGDQLIVISNRQADGLPGPATDAFLVNADGGAATSLGLSAEEVLTAAWWHR